MKAIEQLGGGELFFCFLVSSIQVGSHLAMAQKWVPQKKKKKTR